MNKLSIGLPSTLGSYLKMCEIFFGSDSKATVFIQKKIDESPEKEQEEVAAAESQMVYLLTQIHLGKAS